MKALILVGGYGTRLRPLTLTTPKPLIEFCNKPILFYQIEALAEVGVKLIVLAVNYLSSQLEDQIAYLEKLHDIKIVLSQEKEPLGTAGPLALAREHLQKDSSPVFVLNSDVICQFDLKNMLEQHVKTSAQATISVTTVTDPSKYGVLIIENNTHKVMNFIEKPTNYISNKINAGIYIIQPEVIDRIKCQPTSIEKEVFPALAADAVLYAYDMAGFWMDVGQPLDYLKGVELYLDHLNSNKRRSLSEESYVTGNVLIDSSAVIGKGCKLGPNVVIGANTVIEDGVCLTNCSVLQNVKIKSYSYIDSSIIGKDCVIGNWVRIVNNTVLGENVVINNLLYINGCKILPHKSISESQHTPIIIM